MRVDVEYTMYYNEMKPKTLPPHTEGVTQPCRHFYANAKLRCISLKREYQTRIGTGVSTTNLCIYELERAALAPSPPICTNVASNSFHVSGTPGKHQWLHQRRDQTKFAFLSPKPPPSFPPLTCSLVFPLRSAQCGRRSACWRVG